MHISLDGEDVLGGRAEQSIAGGCSRIERNSYVGQKMAELVAEAKIAVQ